MGGQAPYNASLAFMIFVARSANALLKPLKSKID